MVLSINTQIFYFFSNVFCGLMVGILFDIYRVIRGFKNPNKVLTAISDILFWILASILTFIFMLFTNNVNVRYYTFIALFIGLYVYFSFISKAFLNLLRYAVYYFLKIIRFFVRFLILPFKIIKIVFLHSKFTVRKSIKKFKVHMNKMSFKKAGKNNCV